MEKNREQNQKKVVLGVILVLFFLLFFLISLWSPLAGDDWAYAVNSIGGHPLLLALHRYWSWSGRFFSELWGYIVPRNKWLWDWLNPALFTGIFYLILKQTKAQRHLGVSSLLIFFLIVSVNEYLRMQTYSWIMGTTYVVPMLFFLIYVYLIRKKIFQKEEGKHTFVILCLLNVCTPLWMENMAALMVGANILILLYVFLTNKDKQDRKAYLWFLLISILAVILIRMSPGSNYRLVTDHAAFTSLSLIQQVTTNWDHFLQYTFTESKWLIFTLTVILFVFLIQHWKNYSYPKFLLVLSGLFLLYGLIQPFGYDLYVAMQERNLMFLFDLDVPFGSLGNTLFYGLYVCSTGWLCFSCLEGEKRWVSLFFILCAGGANLIMLISPIFDARSSFYTVYCLITLASLLFEEIHLPKIPHAIVLAVLVGLVGWRCYTYLHLYHTVSLVTIERNQQISWYANDHQVEEGWIVNYPEMSIHSANVEEGDEYHMTFFKKYYNFSPDIQLDFYYRDDYSYKEVYGE